MRPLASYSSVAVAWEKGEGGGRQEVPIIEPIADDPEMVTWCLASKTGATDW